MADVSIIPSNAIKVNDNFYLHNDGMCWNLYHCFAAKKPNPKTGVLNPDSIVVKRTYYSKPRDAFQAILDKVSAGEDITTAQKLISAWERVVSDIDKMLAQRKRQAAKPVPRKPVVTAQPKKNFPSWKKEE